MAFTAPKTDLETGFEAPESDIWTAPKEDLIEPFRPVMGDVRMAERPVELPTPDLANDPFFQLANQQPAPSLEPQFATTAPPLSLPTPRGSAGRIALAKDLPTKEYEQATTDLTMPDRMAVDSLFALHSQFGKPPPTQEEVRNTLESDPLHESVLGISPENVDWGQGPITGWLTALGKGVNGLGQFMTSPSGIVQQLGALTPAKLIVVGKWFYDMSKGTGEAAGNLAGLLDKTNKTPEDYQQIKEEVVNTALMLGGAMLLGTHTVKGGQKWAEQYAPRGTGIGGPSPFVAGRPLTKFADAQARLRLAAERGMESIRRYEQLQGTPRIQIGVDDAGNPIYAPVQPPTPRVPNASQIPPPTEVHGDVRPQPIESQGQVPVEKGRPRVLASPAQAEVLLTVNPPIPVEAGPVSEVKPAVAHDWKNPIQNSFTREMERRGYKLELPRNADLSVNPNALEHQGSRYATFVSPDGKVKLAVTREFLFEREGNVYRGDPSSFRTDGLNLEIITTEPGSRGKGLAGKMMRDVAHAADISGAKLYGEIAPVKTFIGKGQKSFTRKQLFDWYANRGFKKTGVSLIERDPNPPVPETKAGKIKAKILNPKSPLTPMMQQYQGIKESLSKEGHGDALLAFRLGDFYEFFFDDAKQAAKLLKLSLTKRNEVDMAGIPFHAAEKYFKQLTDQGVRVAVIDVVGEVAPGKPAQRRVTEVISPEATKPETVVPPPQAAAQVKAKEAKPQTLAKASTEFDELVKQHAPLHEWATDPNRLYIPGLEKQTSGLGSMGLAAKREYHKQLKIARRNAAKDIGVSPDSMETAQGRAAALPKLKSWLYEQERLNLPEHQKPKLGTGQKQGDLIASTQTEDFAFTGERGKDVDRIAAEKDRAEQTARESAELEKKQQLELGQRPPEKGEGEVAEQRIGGKSKKADIFEMEEGDLHDLFEERFGRPTGKPTPGEFGRPGEFEFPSYDAFRDWMDARYSELDLDGMKLAFAEAPAESKVRYIKENKTADPHKKAWISNLATGSLLPGQRPPVARTTPRPTPGRQPSPPGTPPRPPSGAYPQPPPPPPQRPSNLRRFDMTALVQLFRQFGKFPTVNERLKRAYGRFLTSKEAVELKPRLLWDLPLAERVLAHEIGHFIDLAVPLIGKGKSLAGRLFAKTTRLVTSTMYRNDARDLSRDWRGSFPDGDRYRDTAKELFADFMSAMLNKPEWVNQKYPRLYDAFQNLRDSKPGFKSAYREIETWLQGDTVAQELRAQDRQSVQRTLDILTTEEKKSRSSLKDKLTFSMVTLWQRAYEKEKAPPLIGTRLSEKLERSYMWAGKMLSLWSDSFATQVQPHLERVNADQIQAHADLLSYSKAVRTLAERRTAGRWIEQHPQDAFDLLQNILNLDPSLKAKWQLELDRIGQAGNLYDLAAQVFREMHDKGDRYLDRMIREIDNMQLGVGGQAAMMAFNVRGKLLNPGGLTPETATKMIAQLRDSLGNDRFNALETAHRELTRLMYQVSKEMHEAGLISDKIWTELIEPNKENYLPYAVLDYFEGRVRAGVMKQIGTAKDVADVVASTQLKVASAYAWLQKQGQVLTLREIYAEGGQPLPIGEELKRASDIDRIRQQHPNDNVSRAVIWEDGKPHLIEFPEDAGKQFERAMAMPDFYEHIEWLHQAAKFKMSLMQLFTQFSPRFLLYRNIIRGYRTGALKTGFGSVTGQLVGTRFKRNLSLAQNYADAAFGAPMLPEVRRLVELEALPAPHLARGMVRDLPHLRELLARAALPAFEAAKMVREAPGKLSPVAEKARLAKIATDKLFTGYEAFEKIYNYMAALEKGFPEQTAAAVAERSGIPRPGVTGKWSSIAEILVPWTRTRLQGMRATFDMARDPRFRKGFALRFSITEALPRMAKIAIGSAIVYKGASWLMRKDEQKDDPVIVEVFRRISPYKLALDDVVPLMFYDPRTGQYHPFWTYKRGQDVPKHFEVVSWRIPSSEEGNTFGTMLYHMMLSEPHVGQEMGRPGQGVVENMGAWALNYLVPQPSPFIQTGNQLKDMILQGRNPDDPFRGQPAANPLLFKSGGVDRAQAIAGYTLNQLGGPGELAAVLAANAGLLDERAMNALNRRLGADKRPLPEKIPFTGAVLSYDNYGDYRQDKSAELNDEKFRARARLTMPANARQLYDYYYRNVGKVKKLSEEERQAFGTASVFVNQIWGKTKNADGTPNPDSFYSKAIHAVGPDGSKQARQTLKRDLEQAVNGMPNGGKLFP